MLKCPSLYIHRPLVDSDECAGLTSKQERKHLSLRHRTAGRHYPIQQNLFYRICFSVADGPLHMFSSHWSRVKGWLGCRYYIKHLLSMHWVSPQTLHTEERRLWCGESAGEIVQERFATRGAAVSARRKVGVSRDLIHQCCVKMCFTDTAVTCLVLWLREPS